MTLQIVRDWVLRFNARGPGGLVKGKAPGGRAKLNAAQSQLLQRSSRAARSLRHGVVRWRRKDLVQWIFQEFRISMDETTVGQPHSHIYVPSDTGQGTLCVFIQSGP